MKGLGFFINLKIFFGGMALSFFMAGCLPLTISGPTDQAASKENTAPAMIPLDFDFDGSASLSGQVPEGQTSIEVANLSQNEYVRKVTIDLGEHFQSTNICATKTIFGRHGTAFCSTSDSFLSTSVGGGNDDNDALTSRSDTASAGQSWTSIVIDLGSDFIKSNICSGKYIFGRVGTALCQSLATYSFRDKGAPVSAGRIIPVQSKDRFSWCDHDGTNCGTATANKPVNIVKNASLNTCGTEQTTVAARVAHCASVNSGVCSNGTDLTRAACVANAAFWISATWDGIIDGNSSLSVWRLVTKYADGAVGKEVWLDDNTGLLWSDNLGNLDGNGAVLSTDQQGKFAWCIASGNTENVGSDCRVGVVGSSNRGGVSLCAEAEGLVTPDGAHSVAANANTIVSWDSAGTAIIGAKGGMKSVSTSVAPAVTWRLPTREDFFRAHADGMGYVLPRFRGLEFWSASASINNSIAAWYFGSGTTGFVETRETNIWNKKYIRCVGSAR